MMKNKRYITSLFYFAFIILFNSSSNGQVKGEKSPPNILFIFADDWGYGDLGCYGNKEVETPNLDKFALQGVRFEQFYVTSGVCSPSRSSVITGHFPAAHQIHGHFAGNDQNAKRNMPNWLDANLPVYLPRLMQQVGYKTAHFGKWHLGGGGEPNGDLSAPEPKAYGYDETRVWNGNGPTWKGDALWPTTRYMDDDTVWIQNSSKIAVDETIDFLKRKKKDEPVFINLWLKDPHTPLAPSVEQLEPFQNKGINKEKETYYAVLKDADFHIGRLLKALDELGLNKNTLVIFSSDNGPANYEPARTAGSTAGLKGRKGNLFEGGVRVPCMMRWPGHLQTGSVDNQSVLSTVDLIPTFADIANFKLPADFKADGESFAALFQQRSFHRQRPLFWEWRFPYEGNMIHKEDDWVAGALRSGDWKLLFNESKSRIELYNIPLDPGERTNLTKEEPARVNKLMMKWNKWKTTLPE